MGKELAWSPEIIEKELIDYEKACALIEAR
jgi:hypothetical protein